MTIEKRVENIILHTTNCELRTFSDRRKWLEERVSYLCASETASVIGCGFNDNVWLWKKKTGLTPAVDDISDPEVVRKMEAGSESESHIRELFAIDHDCTVTDGTGILIINQEHKGKDGKPFMACTLDAVCEDVTRSPFILEIKRSESPKLFGDTPPMKYRAQVIKQMIVTGIRRACLVARIVWRDRGGFVHVNEKEYWFNADDIGVSNDMEQLIKVETDFWNDYVLERKEPPLILPSI